MKEFFFFDNRKNYLIFVLIQAVDILYIYMLKITLKATYNDSIAPSLFFFKFQMIGQYTILQTLNCSKSNIFCCLDSYITLIYFIHKYLFFQHYIGI